MPFGDPIVAGHILVRDAIQSPNFAAGVSGWQINRDGSAEFNNATIRGDLIVTDTATSFLEITGDVPAELVNFYSAFYGGSAANFYVRWQASSTEYYYQVIFKANAGTFVAYAEGWVISGAVKESNNVFYVAGAAQKTQVNFLLRNSGNWVAFGQLGATNLSTVFFQDVNISWNHSGHPEADFTIDGTSQGRGYIYVENITGSATSTTSLTEQLMHTMTNNATFKDGRAYKVTLKMAIKSGAVQWPGVNIRETNLAGLQLFGGREEIPVTGRDLPMLKTGYIVNTTGADITGKLCATVTPEVATAVSLDGGTGAAWWLIQDIDTATKFTGATSVV